MAKIIKVGSQAVTPNKIANPFRTSRTSTTNPFKYNNFEGNTLPFEIAADVFTATKTGSTNKFRMVASSVAGSMNKMRTNIAEPIVNFVRRVRENVSSAWAYAKNTNISEVPGFKQVKESLRMDTVKAGVDRFVEVMNTPIHIEALDIMASKMSEIKENMATRTTSVIDASKEIATKLNGVVANISFQGKQKYTNMTVAELETCLATALAEGGINE